MLTGITPRMLVRRAPAARRPPAVHRVLRDVGLRRAQRALRQVVPRRGVPASSTTRSRRRRSSTRCGSRGGSSGTRCAAAASARWPRTSAPTHIPNHRAFPDAAACLEVLWALLERASAYGVTTLADLLEIQSVRSNPHFEKVKLARTLPTVARRLPVRERAARGDLRRQGDEPARARPFVLHAGRTQAHGRPARRGRATSAIVPCDTDLEACALEARLIEKHKPRYNRAGRAPAGARLPQAHRRAASALRGRTKADTKATGLHLGPFASTARARAVASTLSGLFGLRTCTLKLGDEVRTSRARSTTSGRATARARAGRRRRRPRRGRERLRNDLATRPRGRARSVWPTSSRRSPRAGAVRGGGRAPRRVQRRRPRGRPGRRLRALAEAGRVELATPDGHVVLDGGRLAGGPRQHRLRGRSAGSRSASAGSASGRRWPRGSSARPTSGLWHTRASLGVSVARVRRCSRASS